MRRILAVLAAVGVVTACADSTNSSSVATLGAAFQSVPVGFDNAQHSFAGSPSGDFGNPEWGPHGSPGRGPGDRDGHGPGDHGPGFGGFMGGGLGGLFMGDGFGGGFGHNRGDGDLIGVCTYSATTGRISCDPVTNRGLTV